MINNRSKSINTNTHPSISTDKPVKNDLPKKPVSLSSDMWSEVYQYLPSNGNSDTLDVLKLRGIEKNSEQGLVKWLSNKEIQNRASTRHNFGKYLQKHHDALDSVDFWLKFFYVLNIILMIVATHFGSKLTSNYFKQTNKKLGYPWDSGHIGFKTIAVAEALTTVFWVCCIIRNPFKRLIPEPITRSLVAMLPQEYAAEIAREQNLLPPTPLNRGR